MSSDRRIQVEFASPGHRANGFWFAALVASAIAILQSAMVHCDDPTPSVGAEPQLGLVIEDSDMVMPPLSQITATTSAGTITITAGEGFKRCYTWEGATGCVILDEHSEGEANLGFRGASTGGWPPQWREHHGITRVVAVEAQLGFPTIDAFLKWVRRHQICCQAVYRDDGLVVDFKESPGRSQLSVDVFQIYIGAHKMPAPPANAPTYPEDRPLYAGGEKPTKLPGSQNDKIKVGWVSELPKDTLSKHFFFF